MNSVRHKPSFLSQEQVDAYYAQLLQLPWERVVWGPTKPGFGAVDQLVCLVEKRCQVTVMGVFGNYYEKPVVPYHRDEYNADAISLSFGGTRNFWFRSKQERVKYVLRHGDLIYFPEHVNQTHQHGIPKNTNNTTPRINLTMFTQPS